MNEENNQEEEYVEEEIEVYEEVEVDEEEEKDDSKIMKEKSINKISEKEIENNNNKIVNEEKKENIKKNELMNNLFFNSDTEENKYLNLDYKINTEKDIYEPSNNNNDVFQKEDNINLDKNKIIDENIQINNKELNKEIDINFKSNSNNNINDNINNNTAHHSHNFRSKIKRNNKKINKNEKNNNKINNFNTDIPIKKEENIHLLNSNNNKIELKENSNLIEDKIISSLINNNNEHKIDKNERNEFIKEENKDNNNENDTIYNVINNNISVNLENNNKENIIKEEENTENNLINNNESNNEKNKIINKKSQEEEKYENIIIDLCGNNEIIELFENKKWEEKKQGFQKLNQFLNENLENDIIRNNFENIFMFISMKLNNFKETNFNLLKEGIICFNILFSYAKEKNIDTLNKKYLETIIYNLNEKICDPKIKENYIQLLNKLNDLYSYKTVYELLFEILLKTNKINVLKEYSLFIKENIKKENSINNFDLKNLIEFSVKLANNTNPQIRTIAIEIIGLLYTFIGPDLKQLISGIKESTLKLIEKEINKIKFNKDNDNNKIQKNKIKDLIVKKNSKNISEKRENISLNNKRIDISKEITSKLLREINRGKWQEKKEGVEYINSLIDKTNNKISKNGLQDLFELIKDKLNDGNQNFVKMILQLLNHLIISLESQIKFFYNNLIYPLLLKLSDKNKLIRDECLLCIENWIKFQNFDIFAIHIPQLLISNENFELRLELLNLLIKEKELIKISYPKIFFKELTKAFLICLQDKNIKIRNITEELIINYSNFIPREKYIIELKDIKDTISDYLYNIIDKLLPKIIEENISEDKTTEEKEKEKEKEKLLVRQSIVTYDTNNDNDIILVSTDLFSPKIIGRNKNKKNKMVKTAFSLDKKSIMKSKDEIKKGGTTILNPNNNQMNSTVILNTKRNKNIKSKLMGYDKLSSTINKKYNNDKKFNTINIRTKDNNKIINDKKKPKQKEKERNASMILNNKNKINNIETKQDNNINNNKKEIKSLTVEKIIKYKKLPNNNNNTKNESFVKRPVKKINPKKFITSITGGEGGAKNKLFLSSFKIKKGVKEKRYEKDKKNNLYSELQNFDYLPKIKEYFKNVFINDFITKIFSNDLRSINWAISQLKIFIDESLNTNNLDNFNKLIDNLDLILKVIASKIYNNQTASLIKTFFIFADTLINVYKIKKFIFNDTEINILINSFVDKLTNTNLILKETACNLIWFLNDQIDPSKTFTILILLLEYKNAKLKSEIIDIILKLFENISFDINIYTKVLKNLIREYFDSDFNSKKKILYILQNIYNLIGNDFWKYTIFLSSKDRDELENNIETEENEMNYDKDTSREYDIADFSGSGFGEEELIDNNNINNINKKKEKEMHNKSDIDQDDMKLHIKYFKDEDEKIYFNNNPISKNNNHIFKRSITDNANSMKNKETKDVKNINIDKNNYCTNIPQPKNNNNQKENIKEKELSINNITEKELFEVLDMLTNPDEDLVEAIINIHLIAYRNYNQNKKILNQNCDKILSSFIDIISKLFSIEPLRIKIIKYYILVLCKLCNLKEFIENISNLIQKNLIVFVLSNLLKENLNKLGENGEGMDILKSLNSIITHVIEYCDINNNIEIIINLEKKQRKENSKFAEYAARCLIIITQNIKNYSNILNYQKIFTEINNILEDFLNESSELQPKEKTNQTILLTLKNLVNEITKVKNESILDEYNKWIKEKNINNEKFIFNWISESLNRIKIKNNLIGHIENEENSENKNDEYNDNAHVIIGNKKKSLNEIKQKYKELQEKEDGN